jgi:hypothetical protein
MGGLNDSEVVPGPEVGQWAVAVQRRPGTVREHDDRQAVPRHRHGHPPRRSSPRTGAGSTIGLTETTGTGALAATTSAAAISDAVMAKISPFDCFRG